MAARVLAPTVLRPYHRADAAYRSVSLRLAQGLQHIRLRTAEVIGNACKRPRFQGEAALVVVQQPIVVLPAHDQRPVRCARAVRKIPLGLLAAMLARREKSAVS